jgi:hypothetical protein
MPPSGTRKTHGTADKCDAVAVDVRSRAVTGRIRVAALQQPKAIIVGILPSHPFERSVGLENRHESATSMVMRMAASIPFLPVVT